MINFITQNSYLGLFIFGLLNFVIPSEPVLLFAGFQVQQGRLNFGLVVLSALSGSFIKSSIIYLIGYTLGKDFLIKYSRWTNYRAEYGEYIKNKITKYGYRIITPLQFVPLVRRFIAAPCGLLKLDFRRFMFYNLIGVALWFSFLTTVGFHSGQYWQKYVSILHPYITFIGIAVSLGFVVLIAYEFYTSNKKSKIG